MKSYKQIVEWTNIRRGFNSSTDTRQTKRDMDTEDHAGEIERIEAAMKKHPAPEHIQKKQLEKIAYHKANLNK